MRKEILIVMHFTNALNSSSYYLTGNDGLY